MSVNFSLAAQLRTDMGKGASRRLRRSGETIPAIIYGGSESAQPISLSAFEVKKALENEAFYSHILTLNVAGKSQKVVLKAVQRHPRKSNVTHMDFLRVRSDALLTMHVPIHFLNEETCPGVKAGGITSHMMTDLEVKCLPQDLPEFIAIDMAKMELDAVIHLSDIKLPKGVQLTATVYESHDLPVVSIHLPRAAVEEVPEASTEAAPAEGAAGEGSEKTE